ncbi:MAG: ankyrin repeat domain-containing protein [Alphaproteobacteria bacterium]
MAEGVTIIPEDQRKGGAKYPGDKVVTAWLFKDIKESDFAHLSLLLGGYPEAGRYLSEAGHSPLQMAIVHKNDASLRWLLASNATDINQNTEVFGTALHCAINRRQVETVALLLEHGAELELTDKRGNTPLQAAAELNSPEICRLLQDEGLKRLHDTLTRDFNAGTQAPIPLRKPLSVRLAGRPPSP